LPVQTLWYLFVERDRGVFDYANYSIDVKCSRSVVCDDNVSPAPPRPEIVSKIVNSPPDKIRIFTKTGYTWPNNAIYRNRTLVPTNASSSIIKANQRIVVIET